MIVLPEPSGERQGIIGQGKALSILIVGDSAAAGVGVNDQQDALVGSILKSLKDEYQIEWYLQATSGHSTVQVIHALKDIPLKHFDIVVTSVGVNDVTKLMSASTWIKKQHKLYAEIEQRFSPNLIIATGVPPMHMFPALPHPLGWLFGQYAKQMNKALNYFVQHTPHMQWIEYDLERYRELNLEMARDGFHPSKEIYALWGQQVAEKIRQNI